MNTYAINPKTGQPTAHGHENESVKYVEQFKNWIESIEGANIDTIKYIVKNHMKVKPNVWKDMRNKKKEPIKSDPNFQKLKDFTSKLDGGGIDLDKNSDNEYLDEDLKSKIKKGLASAAVVTSMSGSPVIGSETPIKPKETPKEIRTYGISKSTNEIIARLKTLLDINKPIGELTKEELKSAYGRINLVELKNDIESNFSTSDISNLQAELDWVLGGVEHLEYNGAIDKQTVIAIFKYIGRLRTKKPVAGKIPDVKPKSYPFGYIK
jgi:ribosomal protein S13